jgi:hypothetical protein
MQSYVDAGIVDYSPTSAAIRHGALLTLTYAHGIPGLEEFPKWVVPVIPLRPTVQ